MGNIATVFVRLVNGQGRPRASDSEILGALMASNDGDTYGGVPIWLHYREGCLDIQYGARGGPGVGPEDLWARLSEVRFGGALWVRFFDGGADEDLIYSLDELGRSEARWCRYGFDQLAVEWDGRVETSNVRGTYLAGNDRCLLEEYKMYHPSETTPSRGHRGPLLRVDPPAVAAAIEKDSASAREIRLLFHGSLVHRRLRTPQGWVGYGLDGWANCSNVRFLRSRGVEAPGDTEQSDREARATHLRRLVPP